MRPTVLFAAPEARDAQRLLAELRNLQVDVETTFTGADTLQRIDGGEHSLVVLSLELPDVHGLDVCRRLRRDSQVPLIIVGGARSQFDRLLALELGADDFVDADCESAEFAERVRAALRRGDGIDARDQPERVLDFGHIRIDRHERTLTVGDEVEQLTPMELDLMCELAEHAGEVVRSEDLLKNVWGYPPDVKTRTLDVHIGRLRRKLGEDGRNPRHIITVRCVGYRFEPDGEDAEDGDDVRAA